MGVDYYFKAVAIKPADEEYYRKVAAVDACVAAGVEVPEELYTFFNASHHTEISREGVSIEIADFDIDGEERIKDLEYVESFSEDREGFSSRGVIINLKDVPEDVKLIKCTIDCSY